MYLFRLFGRQQYVDITSDTSDFELSYKFQVFERSFFSPEILTASHSMDLKNGWVMISMKPVSLWQPKRSAGFLLRKPFRMEAAFTLKERGILIVFSRMTEKKVKKRKVSRMQGII